MSALSKAPWWVTIGAERWHILRYGWTIPYQVKWVNWLHPQQEPRNVPKHSSPDSVPKSLCWLPMSCLQLLSASPQDATPPRYLLIPSPDTSGFCTMTPSPMLETCAPSAAFGSNIYQPYLTKRNPLHSLCVAGTNPQHYFALVRPLQGHTGYHRHPPQPLQKLTAMTSTTRSPLLSLWNSWTTCARAHHSPFAAQTEPSRLEGALVPPGPCTGSGPSTMMGRGAAHCRSDLLPALALRSFH